MGGGTRSVGAKIAASLWLLVFRVLLGAASMVDGLSKLGILHGSGTTSDLQPSPLGWLSPLVELVAGALVLVGMRTRPAAAVLAVHLAIGLLVVQRQQGDALRRCPESMLDAFLLAVVLVFGSSRLSVDYYRSQ